MLHPNVFNAAHFVSIKQGMLRNSTELDASLVQPLPGTLSPNQKKMTIKVIIKAGLDKSVAPSEVSDTIRTWVSTIRFPLPVSKTTVKFWCAKASRNTVETSIFGGNISERLGRFLSMRCCNPKSYNIHIPLSPPRSESYIEITKNSFLNTTQNCAQHDVRVTLKLKIMSGGSDHFSKGLFRHRRLKPL